jgi:ribokinase
VKILNFGSFCIDHVYQVPHFVRPGETLPSRSHQVFAGGKGFNQSLAMARAVGAAPHESVAPSPPRITLAHAGTIGPDGDFMLAALTEAGVDITDVRRVQSPSGHAVLQVTPSGENAIVLFAGANRAQTRGHIDQVLAGCTRGDLLVLQNEINELPHLLTQAHAQGLRVAFNPAPMDADVPALPLDAVTLLVVNEVEAADLTGAETPARQMADLRARLPGATIILTRGAAGAIWQDAHQTIETPAWPVTAVDTTAAGDTFTGYLIASLAVGLAPDTAMRRAARAAALCVTRPGAADSIPFAAEVAALGQD